MIDTVALTLQADQFRITKPEKFSPNAKGILGILNQSIRTEGHSRAVCNPGKSDGVYKPRMTLSGRVDKAGSYYVTLRVECSLPKLLYGNNFDELTDQDFLRVLDTLSERMAMQGVMASFHDLKYAEVSSIHFGKNILLTDHLTCGSILRGLTRVNINAWFDVAKVDYRNDGHLYKIHSNDFELAFYDKVKDIEKAKKSPKRAYDPEASSQQSLLAQLDFAPRKQVLRMEARLGTRKKIRDVLQKLNRPAQNLTLEGLYSEALAREILLHYWQPYRLGLPTVAVPAGKSHADLYQQIACAKPKAKDGQILRLVAAYNIVDEVGWAGFKSLSNSTPRTLARLRKDLQELDLASSVVVKGFGLVEKVLERFEPLRLDALQGEKCK